MNNLNNLAYSYIGGMKVIIQQDHKTYRYELRSKKKYGHRQSVKRMRVKIHDSWANILEDSQVIRMGDTVVMNPRTRAQLEVTLNSQNSPNNARNST